MRGIARGTQQDYWCTHQFFIIFKIPFNVSAEEPSSTFNVTTVEEEPSSVPSHGRPSSAGSHGRRFFCSCKLQQRKNFPWILAEELLLRDRTEEGFSAVENNNSGRTFFREITWKKVLLLLLFSTAEEPSSVS